MYICTLYLKMDNFKCTNVLVYASWNSLIKPAMYFRAFPGVTRSDESWEKNVKGLRPFPKHGRSFYIYICTYIENCRIALRTIILSRRLKILQRRVGNKSHLCYTYACMYIFNIRQFDGPKLKTKFAWTHVNKCIHWIS